MIETLHQQTLDVTRRIEIYPTEMIKTWGPDRQAPKSPWHAGLNWGCITCGKATSRQLGFATPFWDDVFHDQSWLVNGMVYDGLKTTLQTFKYSFSWNGHMAHICFCLNFGFHRDFGQKNLQPHFC